MPTNKLDPKSLQCVFLGYNEKYKGYRCLHPPTGKVYINRHVLFDELCLPFASTYSHLHQQNSSPLLSAWQQSFLYSTTSAESEDRSTGPQKFSVPQTGSPHYISTSSLLFVPPVSLLRSSTVSPAALIDNSHSSGSASDDDLPGYTPVSSDKQLTRLWFKYQFNTKTVGSVWYSALSTTSKLASHRQIDTLYHWYKSATVLNIS